MFAIDRLRKFQEILINCQCASFASSQLGIGFVGCVNIRRIECGFRLQIEWDIEVRVSEIVATDENGLMWLCQNRDDTLVSVREGRCAQSVFKFDATGEMLPDLEERVGTYRQAWRLKPNTSYSAIPKYESELAPCETSLCPVDKVIQKMKPEMRLG